MDLVRTFPYYQVGGAVRSGPSKSEKAMHCRPLSGERTVSRGPGRSRPISPAAVPADKGVSRVTATLRRPLTCSIGVMAYNEERNIGRLLESLRIQSPACCDVREIVVVASGCADHTEEIAQHAAQRDPRLRVVVQPRREGKARAINVYLGIARGSGVDFCVLHSADTLPQPGTLDALLRPLATDDPDRPRIGMTGAHVVPVNGQGTFLGDVVHTLWRLHHRVALEAPKMGELVAFRNVVDAIPAETAVDEVSLEVAIRQKGLSLLYVPEAIVHNKGPETLSDFMKQRRRIHAGHLDVRMRHGYAPATMSLARVTRHFAAHMLEHPSRLPAGLGAAALEATARVLGAWDIRVARRSHAVWDAVATTKDVRPG